MTSNNSSTASPVKHGVSAHRPSTTALPSAMDALGLDFARSHHDSPGSRSMSRVYGELEQLQVTAPQWFAQFEDSDLMSMPGLELVRLLDTAPNTVAKGFMAGILSARLHLCQVTGRPLFDL